MGAYHRQASFDLFSHFKSVQHRSYLDFPMRYPPYKNKFKMIKRLLNTLVNQNNIQVRTMPTTESPNVDTIYRQLNQLISQPIRPISRPAMAKYLAYFEEKCARSKQMVDDATQYIPGGVQHNLAFNYPHPVVFPKAEGLFVRSRRKPIYRFLTSWRANRPGQQRFHCSIEGPCLDRTMRSFTGLFHEYELKIAKNLRAIPFC